jgi:hypothetical protein
LAGLDGDGVAPPELVTAEAEAEVGVEDDAALPPPPPLEEVDVAEAAASPVACTSKPNGKPISTCHWLADETKT